MVRIVKIVFAILGFLVLSVGMTSWANTLATTLASPAAESSKSGAVGPLDVHVVKPKKAKVGKKAKFRVEVRIGEKAEAITMHVRPADKAVKVFKAARPITRNGPFGAGSQTSFDFQLKTSQSGEQAVNVDISLLQQGQELKRTIELKVNFTN